MYSLWCLGCEVSRRWRDSGKWRSHITRSKEFLIFFGIDTEKMFCLTQPRWTDDSSKSLCGQLIHRMRALAVKWSTCLMLDSQLMINVSGHQQRNNYSTSCCSRRMQAGIPVLWVVASHLPPPHRLGCTPSSSRMGISQFERLFSRRKLKSFVLEVSLTKLRFEQNNQTIEKKKQVKAEQSALQSWNPEATFLPCLAWSNAYHSPAFV